MSNTAVIGERRRSPAGSVYEAVAIGRSHEPRDGVLGGDRPGVFVHHVGGSDAGSAVKTGWVGLKTPLGNPLWESWDLVGEPAEGGRPPQEEPPAPDWAAVALKFQHATEALRACEINVPIQVASRILDAESAYKAARAT